MKDKVLVYCLALTLGLMSFLRILTHLHVPDPDTFYHLRMARLFGQGVLQNFPWLSSTVLSSRYVEHHFLFHLLLKPFLFAGDWLGLDLFLVFQACAFVIVIYYLIRKKTRTRWLAGFFCLIPIFTSWPFLFVLNVGRAQILSLILLLLGTFLIYCRKWKVLVLLTVFYTLTYNGFVLILLPLIIDAVLVYIYQKKFYWQNIAAVAIGIGVGTLIHPNFPSNILFYWDHIVRIGVLPIHIPTGAGWLPYSPYRFLMDAVLPIILFLAATYTLFKQGSYKDQIYSSTLGICALLFGLLCFRSQLFIIYFVPFAVLFSANALSDKLRIVPASFIKNDLLKSWQFVFSICLITALLLWYGYFSLNRAYSYIIQSPKQHIYKNASEWLKTNSEPGDIVFNPQWDQFPQLFYWNDKNYYIVGLDPIFMYEQSPYLYWQWRKISDDDPAQWQSPEDIYSIVKNDFHAPYIFIENDRNPNLLREMSQNPQFREVYRDEHTTVFALP